MNYALTITRQPAPPGYTLIWFGTPEIQLHAIPAALSTGGVRLHLNRDAVLFLAAGGPVSAMNAAQVPENSSETQQKCQNKGRKRQWGNWLSFRDESGQPADVQRQQGHDRQQLGGDKQGREYQLGRHGVALTRPVRRMSHCPCAAASTRSKQA